MLRSLINTVLWFCAPTPGGYLHALVYKRISKALQVLKGSFLGHFSFPLNPHFKQLLRSPSKAGCRQSSDGSRSGASSCQAAQAPNPSLLRPPEPRSHLPRRKTHHPSVELTMFNRGAAGGVIWLNLIVNSLSSNCF